jgi:hypothetical protein
VPGRWRPLGQHRKRLVARTTAATANPHPPVPMIVRMFEALSVADDGPRAAKWASSREQRQRDLSHPGSVFRLGQCDKKNHGCVKADAYRPVNRIAWLAFTLLVWQCRTKEEYRFRPACVRTLLQTSRLAGILVDNAHQRRVAGEESSTWVNSAPKKKIIAE